MFVNEYNQRYAQEYGKLFMICWMLCPLLLTGVEFSCFAMRHRTIPKGKLLGSLLRSNIFIYLFLFLIVLYAGSLTGARRKAYRISCTSNLKLIGLSLGQYALDNNDWLPDKSGAAGFEQLRSNDYLTDYQAYICPSKPHPQGEGNQELTEEIVSYIYRSGLKLPDRGEDASGIPVAWDKPANHENYGNVLFLDGHVKGFPGADWMEQAGIKRRADK